VKLQLFKTMWGFEGDFETACIQAKSHGFDGIEGQLPITEDERRYWQSCLQKYGLVYIQEIVTGGNYVPDRSRSVADHLNDIKIALEHSHELQPLFITCIGGCDAWSDDESIRFFAEAMAIAETFGIRIRFETHRSRCLFTPWRTRAIVNALPQIELTADISHWCVVCERQMDMELDTIAAIAPHVRHIHARVGYDQGPQVTHPAAPEYTYALKAHQQCWGMFWQSQYENGTRFTTMTPEFGPDGYLHTLPFTQAPVADLWEINCWMAEEERLHFGQWHAKERA